MRGCQHLVLWTDGDREGEGIAAEIVEVVTNGMLLEFVCVCVDRVLSSQSNLEGCKSTGQDSLKSLTSKYL